MGMGRHLVLMLHTHAFIGPALVMSVHLNSFSNQASQTLDRWPDTKIGKANVMLQLMFGHQASRWEGMMDQAQKL